MHDEENIKPALKHNVTADGTKKKAVIWDYQQLEELEEEKIKNPKQKIDEPKTPYIYCVSYGILH
jgi:hypothetical protein